MDKGQSLNIKESSPILPIQAPQRAEKSEK